MTASTMVLVAILSLLLTYVSANTVKTHVGFASTAFSALGDGGPALAGKISNPKGIYIDKKGNTYIADYENSLIRLVNATSGLISTIAGGGGASATSDGISATLAFVNTPWGVAGDAAGNIYYSEANGCRVRMIAAGKVSTIAGTGNCSYSGDGLQASMAKLNMPAGIFYQTTSNILYIADTGNARVRAIDMASRLISTIAGNGQTGFNATVLTATATSLSEPYDVWVSSLSEVYIADSGNCRIRVVSAGGQISTFAGTGVCEHTGSDSAVASTSSIAAPTAVCGDASNVYFFYSKIGRAVDSAQRTLKTIAGSSTSALLISGANSTSISLGNVYGCKVQSALVMASSKNVLWNVTNGLATSLVGYIQGVSLPSTAVSFGTVYGLIGNGDAVYISESDKHRVHVYSAASGMVSVLAGHGSAGYNGISIAASKALLNDPRGLAVDASGNVYVAEYGNHRVRKISTSLVITTVAGTGAACTGTWNATGPATNMPLCRPYALAVYNNALYVSDGWYSVKKIDLATQLLTAVVGSGKTGFSASLTSAYLNPIGNITAMWFNSAGRLLLADSTNNRIRQVSLTANTMSTFAGNGVRASSLATDILASSQPLQSPVGVCGSTGSVFILQNSVDVVRAVDTTGMLSTYIGNNVYGIGGELVDGMSAAMGYGMVCYCDADEYLFYAESTSLGTRIRKAYFAHPTSQPSSQPSKQPVVYPTSKPSMQPIVDPTSMPSVQPSSRPSSQPICHPTARPTSQPSRQPSRQPSSQPTSRPTSQPVLKPTSYPSHQPTSIPTSQPVLKPTSFPSHQPSSQPTTQPVLRPTGRPSGQPSSRPTRKPSSQPSRQPSAQPSSRPSRLPTSQPTSNPTQPTSMPTVAPLSVPTAQPSGQPTSKPSMQPSGRPTGQPSSSPTKCPSAQPSGQPSEQPSSRPSVQPSTQPSSQPTQPTSQPTAQPSLSPSTQPSTQPSIQPTSRPSGQPSMQPSSQPTQPTAQPTGQPSMQPSRRPTMQPSRQPSDQPSSQPTRRPTCQPSMQPTSNPTQPTSTPTSQPSIQPSVQPTSTPTQPTSTPTGQPTRQPSRVPTGQPSIRPTMRPSSQPSVQPSASPSVPPTSTPTGRPSGQPSRHPASVPSAQPSLQPSIQPTSQPTRRPTCQPTVQPSRQPTGQPSSGPTAQPSSQPTSPTAQPSEQPSGSPSGQPSSQPSMQPSAQPSMQPSSQPSRQPTAQPSRQPSTQPSVQPTRQPSAEPSRQPSTQPTRQPTSQPSMQPSRQPSEQPTGQPSRQPSMQPSSQPSEQPSSRPTCQPSSNPTSPTTQPTRQPSAEPSRQPSSQPSRQPTQQPTMQPSRQPSSQPTAQPSRQPTMQPSRQPSQQPTGRPSRQPSSRPSGQPSQQPTMQPSRQPTMQPSRQPTQQPTMQPSRQPTQQPTRQPTCQPSRQPSRQPTRQPSADPTSQPSMQPSRQPFARPTGQPSVQPSRQPSSQPSIQPTSRPSSQPSSKPSMQPSVQPTRQPSRQPFSHPTAQPSHQPSARPSADPTAQPSGAPTSQPSSIPSGRPTCQPSTRPSSMPSSSPTAVPSAQPSSRPSGRPSGQPSSMPSTQPTQPSSMPTAQPSSSPTAIPSSQPTAQPSSVPTAQPTAGPTSEPSGSPSSSPTAKPTVIPTGVPSSAPSALPSSRPSSVPTVVPSAVPSSMPSSRPSSAPSSAPSSRPSSSPSARPTSLPSARPSSRPSSTPSSRPSAVPSARPSVIPSSVPTNRPTASPSAEPTSIPSSAPTSIPTVRPTSRPTSIPTSVPTSKPSAVPSARPSARPSSMPSSLPTAKPSATPSADPTAVPTSVPSSRPSSRPTASPTSHPTVVPTSKPSSRPTSIPSVRPSAIPSSRPTSPPTGVPTVSPTSRPSVIPTAMPSVSPSSRPTSRPTSVPTVAPTSRPTARPSAQPSGQPTKQPVGHPTSHPSVDPSAQPSSHPTRQPVAHPSAQPVATPTSRPSMQPFASPSRQPFAHPTSKPSSQPSSHPSGQPTSHPTQFVFKHITVQLGSNSITEGVDMLSFLNIVLDGTPRNDLTITVNTFKTASATNMTAVQAAALFVPSSFQVAGGAESSAAITLQANLIRPAVGTYAVSIALTGASTREYLVDYSRVGNASATVFAVLTVLTGDVPLAAPELSSATFAPDGSYLAIGFSGETNRANLPVQFGCSSLFAFNCANISSCNWIDNTNVRAFVATNAYCATPLPPANALTLSAGALVKARCVTKCTKQSSWPNARTNSTVLIASPATKIRPTVIINMPDTVGSCASVTVDLTGSTGDGGRAWASRDITVSSADAAGKPGDTSALQAFLSSSAFKIFPPTPLVSTYFIAGQIYSFDVKLCNFLASCSTVTRKLIVLSTLVPSISIPGTSSLTSKRRTALFVAAQGSLPACNNTVTSAAEGNALLQYSWTVSLTNGTDLRLPSFSKDTSKLLLAAYALQANITYVVTATAKVNLPTSTTKASTAVIVYVAPGAIVPVIADGLTRNVRVGRTLTLDASKSYDEDVVGESALLFQWSCLQTSPVVATSCSGIFSDADFVASKTSSSVKLIAVDTAANAIAQVTLTVFDQQGVRSAQSTVQVTILPALAAVLQLTSSSSLSKVNALLPLQLVAKVDVPAALSGSVQWSIDSSTGVALSSVALSAAFNTSFPASPIAKSYSYYLPLNPRLLPAGISLSFSLRCSLQDPGTASATSIAVMVNSPPRPGLFTISPDTQVELIFPFSFVCSRWLDDDLPLTYQFGFVSSAGDQIVLRSKLQTSFADLTLPAGLASNGFVLTTFAQIFDSLSGNNSATYAVQVTETPAFTTAQLNSFVATSLASSSNSVDDIKQATSISSYLLNRVNCSQATNCGSLQRKTCYRTAQTCGPCLAEYLGDAGDANDACYLASLVKTNYTAVSDVDKTCASNCSGHGQCVYTAVVSGQKVDHCVVGDFSCMASCQCISSYVGSLCSLSAAELQSKQALRQDVLTNLVKLSTLEDADAESLQSLVSNLNAAAQSADELSVTSSTMVLDLASYVLSNMKSAGLSGDAAADLLTAVQTSLTATQVKSLFGRRLSADASTLQRSQEVLDQYASFVADSLAPGQNPVLNVQPSFRIHVSKHDLSGTGCTQAMITLPSKPSEDVLGVQTGSLNVPLCSNGSSMAIAAISTAGVLYDNSIDGNTLQSNPLSLTMSAFPCNSSDCHVEFVMSRQQYNKTIVQVVPERFNVSCKGGDLSTYLHTCSDGQQYPVTCTEAGWVEGVCPYTQMEPSCSALEGMVSVDYGCVMLSYTAENITCSCPLTNSNSTRRLAAATNSTGSISVSYVSMLLAMRKSFTTTVRSAQGLDESTVTKGFRAMATIGAFALSFVIALYCSHAADVKANKIKTEKAVQAKGGRKKSVMDAIRRNSLHRDGIQKGFQKKVGFLQLAQEALPMMLNARSFVTLVKEELKRHHRWFGVVYHYSDKFSRSLRVASLATNIIIMLFIQSVTYNLANGDDGTCETNTNEVDCLAAPSGFATGESKCYWTPPVGTATAGTCLFVQPDQSMKVMLFVAVFSSLISIPIAVSADYVITHYLAAPTALQPIDRTKMRLERKRSRFTSIAPGPASAAPAIEPISPWPMEKRAALTAVDAVTAQYLKLIEGLKGHFGKLEGTEKREFKELWGLDDAGDFMTPPRSLMDRLSLARLKNAAHEEKEEEQDNKQGVAALVFNDLISVQRHVSKETGYFHTMSDKEKSKRLLYLFQKDLLPGICGQILESKATRDSEEQVGVSSRAKWMSWGFLFVLDFGLLFYVLLFAISQTANRQTAWVQSFIMWLVAEIFFVSTVMVLLMNIALPTMIMKDVKEIKSKLLDSLVAYYQKIQTKSRYSAAQAAAEEEEGVFNAADFLFVSCRLAKSFAGLKASEIISQYQTIWPRQSYHHVVDVSKNYSRKWTALTRSASMIAVFFLTNLLSVPLAIQNMVIQVVSTAVTAYTFLIHLQLYAIYPILVIIPTLVLIVLAHFVVQAMTSGKEDSLAALLRKRMPKDSSKEGDKEGKEAAQHQEEGEVHEEHSEHDSDLVSEDEGPLHKASPSRGRSWSSDEDDEEDAFPAFAGMAAMDRQRALLAAEQLLSDAELSTNKKQSVQQGLQLLQELHATQEDYDDDDKEYSISSSSGDAPASSREVSVIFRPRPTAARHSETSTIDSSVYSHRQSEVSTTTQQEVSSCSTQSSDEAKALAEALEPIPELIARITRLSMELSPEQLLAATEAACSSRPRPRMEEHSDSDESY